MLTYSAGCPCSASITVATSSPSFWRTATRKAAPIGSVNSSKIVRKAGDLLQFRTAQTAPCRDLDFQPQSVRGMMLGGRDGADNVDDGGCKIIGARDMIHLGRLKRSQRHLVRGRVQGMLHDRGAAAGLDRVQTGGAIVEHPREHQPHGARAKGQGHGPEHRVDGRTGHVLARAHTQADRVANHQKMSVGRRHIDMAGFDRLSVDGGRDRQCAPAAEGRGENAGRMGRDMGRDEDACRKVGRQVLQDRLKHLSASGRTTDGNDVLVLLVHRSPASVGSLCALGGHIHPGQPPLSGIVPARPGQDRSARVSRRA